MLKVNNSSTQRNPKERNTELHSMKAKLLGRQLRQRERANVHYWVDRPWLQSDKVNIKDSFNKQETKQKRLLDMLQPKTKKISRLHLYFSSHNHLVIIVPNPKC